MTTRRELSPKERLMAVLLSANVHGLIRDLDDLKHTEIYQHKVKMTANAFLSALEVHAKEKLWGVDI
ncbi:MAG TPA: hypothetical protein VGN64_01260, partial [Dyadobacter sp.]|nr:hypothetical protein [Dyadobacter sp.]